MTQLRQRMIEDMQLRGYSARTQEAYARGVRQLAEYFHRSPDLVNEEELREYFLYLANEKKYAARPRLSRYAASNSSMNRRCSAAGPRCTSFDRPTSSNCQSC